MTPDRNVRNIRNVLMSTAAAVAGLALLVPISAMAAEPGLDQAALDHHAAVVATVVQAHLSTLPSAEDQKRSLALVKSLLDTRKTTRNDVAGRTIQPLSRREAILKGLQNNLSLAIGRPEPDRIQTLVREAQAVFDPVFDLSLGYNRQDSFLRQKVGTVKPKGVYTRLSDSTGGENIGGADNLSGFGREANGDYIDPLQTNFGPLVGNRRLNTCNIPFYTCPDLGKPQVRALEFYQNSNTAPVQTDIVANSKINNGHPLQQTSVSLGLTQELPWGGSLQVTSQNIQQKIYYDANHYWQDGQWTSNLSAALNTPVPFGKGFGTDNPDHANIQNAEIARQQADWALKDLVNLTLEQVDLAYFEVARQLQALATTVESRDLVLKLKERQDRIIKQEPGLVTRYQEAQIKAEVSRAEVAVEQQLQSYLSASVALALLIGSPDARTGAAIFLPYGYGQDLATPTPVTFDGALTTARVNRPAYFIARLGRDSADVSLRLAQNQARPDIRFGANVSSGENGSTYGYANPGVSLSQVVMHPDSINQNYSLTYTYPWMNRAAEAAVDIARLSVEDRDIVIRQTETMVRQQIATDMAAVQSARARMTQAAAQTKSQRDAYESLDRQLGAGLVGEDQIIQALRTLVLAEMAKDGAAIDNREAETALLYDQGIIANALPGQTALSALERRRLTLLADAGVLKYFGPEKKK